MPESKRTDFMWQTGLLRWVAAVDGEAAAVWSKDYGTQLLVPDRKLDAGSVDIFYHYYVQMDAMWVFEQLASGVPANRFEMQQAYEPIAEAKRMAELRKRERETTARLLSPECVAALQQYGAEITLHADNYCALTILGHEWTATSGRSSLRVRTGPNQFPTELKPVALGEAWLVARAGALVREQRGLPALSDFNPNPGLTVQRAAAPVPSPGDYVATVPRDDETAQLARFAHGRSLEEIRNLLAG